MRTKSCYVVLLSSWCLLNCLLAAWYFRVVCAICIWHSVYHTMPHQHARQHCTSNCSHNMTTAAWLYCTCSARFMRAKKESFYREWRGEYRKIDSCVMKVNSEGPFKMEDETKPRRLKQRKWKHNLLEKKVWSKTKQQNGDSKRRRVVYKFLISAAHPLRDGVHGLAWATSTDLAAARALWYWPCLPGRPLEAASNEAPVPGSQSCCRTAECLQWKPPQWNQWRCGWCVVGSPERIPGSSLEKRLRTPAGAHMKTQSSSSRSTVKKKKKGLWLDTWLTMLTIRTFWRKRQSQFIRKLIIGSNKLDFSLWTRLDPQG